MSIFLRDLFLNLEKLDGRNKMEDKDMIVTWEVEVESSSGCSFTGHSK